MSQLAARVRAPRDSSRQHAWSAAVALVMMIGAAGVYHEQWRHPFTTTLGSAHHTNDPMQMMWNLHWVASQVVSGHNPFTTRAIYYPHGVALTWNTLTPSLGVLAAPVTLTLGAAFSYALLMTLAPALAAITGYWWLRRHTRHHAAAALGGVVIGFNPYMSGHMLGHLDLTFTALVPVMLILTEDLLWRHPRRARTTAVYLGLVTAIQAGISEELILITVLGVLVATAAFAVVDRHAARSAFESAWRGIALAIAVFLLAAAPLLIEQLFLSAHVPLHAAGWGANLGDYLLPVRRMLFDPGLVHASRLGGAEDGVYLGPALITVLVVGIACTAARDRLVRVAAITLVGLVALTFGPAGPGGVPMPWRYLSRLPVLTSILPARFSFASFLVIAWLVSHWADGLLDRATDGRRARVRAGLGLAAILGSLVLLASRDIGTSPLPRRTPLFTSSAIRTLVPRGAPVLLLPSPTPADTSGMYYQQQADFQFDQPGGYALRAENGGAAYGPPDSPLVRVSAQAARGAADPRDLMAARDQLTTQHYRAIVVVDGTPGGTRLAQQLTGRAADRQLGGASIWLLGASGSLPVS